MEGEVLAAIAAAADVGLVVAHGVIGHRWHLAQLRPATFQPTALVGDADLARRFFTITWHLLTVVFVASALAFALAAAGEVRSPPLLRFVAASHGGFLVVALAYVIGRGRAILRPI